mgnify:CR=1 FL=1
MLVSCNTLIGADKTAEQIGFKAIIKYNKLDFYAFVAMQKPNKAGREHYMKREQIAKNIVADLKELAALTSDADGAQRVAWTPTFKKATEWFAQKMQAAGAEVWTDAAGNSWAKFAGTSEDAIVIGSHLDSVPDGGWLDGALGVVAGMGIGAYGLADTKPAKTLYVVGWADEEGVAFGKSCLGSSAVSGIVTSKDVLPLIHQEDGRRFSDVWQEYGLNANRIGEAYTAFSKLPVKAYLELHIEQAPLLALDKKSVACVYGVCGCNRQYITFRGQQGTLGGQFPHKRIAVLRGQGKAPHRQKQRYGDENTQHRCDDFLHKRYGIPFRIGNR